MANYSKKALLDLGFHSVGDHVLISTKASFYGCERISLGDHVRIDDFCVLSAGENGISIGNYIHIAVFSSLIGAEKITINDFCNISSRVSIYSSSDDYSGEYMTNPMVDRKYTKVDHGKVTLHKHVIVGSGCVILPNVTIGEGSAIGALSLVNRSIERFSIYAGQPAKFIKTRQKNVLTLAAQLQRDDKLKQGS